MDKEWEVKKQIITKLEKIRDKHNKKANSLTDKKKFSEATSEIYMALGVSEAIHEILYKHKVK
jgi:hypothetical protein